MFHAERLGNFWLALCILLRHRILLRYLNDGCAVGLRLELVVFVRLPRLYLVFSIVLTPSISAIVWHAERDVIHSHFAQVGVQRLLGLRACQGALNHFLGVLFLAEENLILDQLLFFFV